MQKFIVNRSIALPFRCKFPLSVSLAQPHDNLNQKTFILNFFVSSDWSTLLAKRKNSNHFNEAIVRRLVELFLVLSFFPFRKNIIWWISLYG